MDHQSQGATATGVAETTTFCEPSPSKPHSRRPANVRLLGLIALNLTASACTVTSPHWDYVPESTSATIPVQAWTPYTSAPIVVECAQNTNAHGGPSPDDSAYIVAATIPVSTGALLDSDGNSMYSAAANVTIPSACWDYFGSYDFWQLNMRITQMQPNPLGSGTIKKVFSSFDLSGLSCLGSTNGAAGSFLGFVNQGCEKTYLGSDELIPYITLRIEGYNNGLNARASTTNARRAVPEQALAPNTKTTEKILSITAVTPEQVEMFRKQQLEKK